MFRATYNSTVRSSYSKKPGGRKCLRAQSGVGRGFPWIPAFRRYDGFDLGMTVLIWDGYLKPEQLQA